MPPAVRCPVCERRHTIEEYEDDRFCRTCGALLRVERRTGRKGEGWRALFPYEPYPQQVEFMDDVLAEVMAEMGTPPRRSWRCSAEKTGWCCRG